MQIRKQNSIKSLFLFLLLGFSIHSYGQSKSELIEELIFFIDNIKNIHPEPFQHILNKKFENLKNQIAKKIDEDCSIEKFYILTAPLVAALQNGHSVVAIPVTKNRISYLNKGGLVFSLKLEIDSIDRFIVKANM